MVHKSNVLEDANYGEKQQDILRPTNILKYSLYNLLIDTSNPLDDKA